MRKQRAQLPTARSFIATCGDLKQTKVLLDELAQ
jgi:hypothetical protein